MYISTVVAERIKKVVKNKNISITKMLMECELNKNTLSSMQSRGSWLQANSLAKIADYLDCSVDYLLGRTDVPEVNRTNILSYPKEVSYKIAAYGADGTEGTQPPIEEKTT